MKRLLYLSLVILAGCTSGIDLTNDNATIAEKSQTVEMRSRHAARYILRAKTPQSVTTMYIDAHEDWGRVGDVITFSNRAMLARTPVTRLED